jgi:hypothetical protein
VQAWVLRVVHVAAGPVVMPAIFGCYMTTTICHGGVRWIVKWIIGGSLYPPVLWQGANAYSLRKHGTLLSPEFIACFGCSEQASSPPGKPGCSALRWRLPAWQ